MKFGRDRWSSLAAAVLGVVFTSAAHAGSFTEALESAYVHNPRIAAERSRQEATDEGVSQALSGYRPTVTANYQVGKQRNEINAADATNNTYQNQTLSVSEPLFRGGATWAGYQSAKQQVKAGQYQLIALEQNVLLDAITAYMDVVQANAVLELAQNNREVLEKQLAAAQDRFKVGEVTRTDVAQSDARLSGAKANVIAAQGQVIAAAAAFERVVGHKPEGVLEVPDSAPEVPVNLNDAIAASHDSNPDLLAAIHAAKAAHYDVDVTASSLLPQVALVGSMSRQYGMGIPGESQFAQDRVGVNVSIPLYQSGAEYSRVRAAESIARQRKHQSMDAQMLADEQVTQAWQQLQTAIASIRMRQDQVTSAETSLDGVKQEQQYGSRTVLDVLNAEEELFSAKTDLVRAQRNRVVAAFTLAMTLGKLTPANLALNTPAYDASKHYDSIKYQPIGF